MDFEIDKLYKIVYKDGDEIKAPKGYIIGNDSIYLILQFKDKAKLFINHSNIISISEVSQ